MVLNEKEGLECEVLVDGMRLEYVSEFQYLEYVFWRNRAQMLPSVIGRWRVGGKLQV